MKCAAKGCKNEVTRPKTGRPRKYCAGRECELKRAREVSLTWSRQHGGGKHPGPPYICEECKFLIYPPDARPRTHCSAPECQRQRVNRNVKAAYERKAKPKRLVKQAKVKPAEKTKYVRPLPAPITRHWSEEPDRDAKMRNLDRGTRKGFKWYWEMNPIHFDHLFPGLPVGIGDGK